MTARRAEAEAPAVTKEAAGRYRTDDRRYLIQEQSEALWVTDTEQLDELGQPVMHGPFESLSNASGAIGGIAEAAKPGKSAKSAKAAKAAKAKRARRAKGS
jgi:hypothetical protein